MWIDIEPSKQDLESYDLSKKVLNLLRHNQKLHREEDGAIQFYKIKFHLRDHPSQIQGDDVLKKSIASGMMGSAGPQRAQETGRMSLKSTLV